MESSPAAMAPLLLRNLLTSLFFYADKPLVFLAEKYRLLELLRCFLLSAFLFFLRLLPSLFPGLNSSAESYNYSFKTKRADNYASTLSGGGGGGAASASGGGVGDSGVARALMQLLSIVNDIPVSSRKYELVRSLAEKVIDENLLEGNETLREVNCAALSAAFSRTLSQLEAAVLVKGRSRGGGNSGDVTDEAAEEIDIYYYKNRFSRFLKAVKYYGNVVWRYGKSREGVSGFESSAEKLAAEVLWLAQKMAACGCSEEAVFKWASASNLASLALSAELRLQGSLVKVSAFLIKQSKDVGKVIDDKNMSEQQRQTKMKLLVSWLPLLCRASNGTDAPVLSIGERAELEKILEEIIETLEQEDEQERVLSLWLHHFTRCPSSDWPNLRGCYTRWLDASRSLLLHQ
ncbi:unnamed protein product [Fraxinus pennsylvanica]|uniref:Uncharacterized protein n=1 Tax=Fraxinus pennsylvanica TaxID=56036 RepID=A0AAD1ZEA5_9LAMI|nr:unnamed protein product [Fraxinus pennsylvanica]